jgi:hypothetical protein
LSALRIFMKGAKIRGGIDGLERFQKALRDAGSMRVKVGVLGKKNGRDDGITNAEVGAKQEFGFYIAEGPFKGAKVPARSFLRMPLRELIAHLPELFTDTMVPLLKKFRVEDVFKRLGVLAVKAIDNAFETQGGGQWAPNAPTTILIKGYDKPLIHTTQLRRSIAFEVTGKK